MARAVGGPIGAGASLDEAPPSATSQKADSDRLIHPLLHSKRILVVDNEQSSRDEIVDTLGRFGTRAEAVPTGEIAAQMVRFTHYDAVLVDGRLSGKGAFDCCVQLREISPQLVVILMHGFGFDPDHTAVRLKEVGLKYLVFKPLTDKSLNALESALAEQGHVETLPENTPEILAKGMVQGVSSSNLTSPQPMSHHEDVETAKVNEAGDWASNLSMKEALEVLEQNKAQISPLILPAISTLVRAAQKRVLKREPEESSFQELRQLAESDTETLLFNFNRINELFKNLKGVKFRSATELQEAVADIQMIVRRGKFELVLSEPVSKLEAGTKVLISTEKPARSYKIGRIVAAPDNDWAASVRRVSFLPLQLSRSSGGDS